MIPNIWNKNGKHVGNHLPVPKYAGVWCQSLPWSAGAPQREDLESLPRPRFREPFSEEKDTLSHAGSYRNELALPNLESQA